MNLRQAAQQALDEMIRVTAEGIFKGELNETITALRIALAEPFQNEPLAWFRLDEETNEAFLVYFPSEDGKDWRPLYAMPRKPLTDKEIQTIWAKTFEMGSSANTFARAIERAHGIGEQHGS